MNCPQCETGLLVEVFGTSNPIRCPACTHVLIPPNQASTQVNQFAWRSFWLGLSSIFLLFLTGIPAIWYGVRSLLQMRFTRSQKSDKKAAVAGVILGVIFGILGTGLLVVAGAIIALMMMIIEETSNPDRMAEILAEIGTIEVPDGFQMVEAAGVKNQLQRVDWRDGTKAKQSQGRIRLAMVSPKSPGGGALLNQPKISFQLHSDIEFDEEGSISEEILWRFAGKPRNITKVTEVAKDKKFDAVRYIASTDEGEYEKVYMLVVNIRQPGNYSESNVLKIFESFNPTPNNRAP